MTFEQPAQAFQHAVTQTDDDATHVIVEGLMQMIAELNGELEAMRREILELRNRLPDPDQPGGG